MTVKFMNVHSYSYKPESLPSASLYNEEQVRLVSQDNSVNWKQFKIILIFLREEMSTYLIL